MRIAVLWVALAFAACNTTTVLAPTGGPTPTGTPPATPPTPTPTATIAEFPDDPEPERTYVGEEFWAIDLDTGCFDQLGCHPPPALLVVNASTASGTVFVDAFNGTISTATVATGASIVVSLPDTSMPIYTDRALDARRVRSTVPVHVQQINPYQHFQSADSSALLPSDVLGAEYRVMGWPQADIYGWEGLAYITVIGVGPGPRTVTITSTATTYPGAGLPLLQPGDTVTTTVGEFEALQISTTGPSYPDFSGTHIVADGPIAVFSGTECSEVPLNTVACDHLEEQMPPLSAWGTEYVLARAPARGISPTWPTHDVFRLVAHEPGTVVTLDPPHELWGDSVAVDISFPRDVHFHWGDGTRATRLTSNKPILVGHFLGGGRDPYATFATGDPAFVIVPSRDRWRSDRTVFVPDDYDVGWISVYGIHGTLIELDGAVFANEWIEAGDSGYGRAELPITPGMHRIRTTSPVGVTVILYGNWQSLAFVAGANY